MKTILNATGLWVKVAPKLWKIKRIDNLQLLEKELGKVGKTLEDVRYKAPEKGADRILPRKEYYDNLEVLYPGQGWKEKGEENELKRFARTIKKSFRELEEQTTREEQGQSI
jgi:hypothetical protein